jgi:hypothetical protein
MMSATVNSAFVPHGVTEEALLLLLIVETMVAYITNIHSFPILDICVY